MEPWPLGKLRTLQPKQRTEADDQYRSRLCGMLAQMNENLNPEDQINDIIRDYKDSPCREQKILAHLRSVHRRPALALHDATEPPRASGPGRAIPRFRGIPTRTLEVARGTFWNVLSTYGVAQGLENRRLANSA